MTLRAGLVVTLVAGALFSLPVPVEGLVVARALHGLADALVYTAASAWVLDRTPPAGVRTRCRCSAPASGAATRSVRWWVQRSTCRGSASWSSRRAPSACS